MTLPIVPRSAAIRKQTHHQFVQGLGYVPHAAEPDLPPTYPVGSKNCMPPQGTMDGTAHLMKPSHNHPPMRMIWIALERAWAATDPGRGNRMAWTADYLSRAGWEYLGPSLEVPDKGLLIMKRR